MLLTKIFLLNLCKLLTTNYCRTRARSLGEKIKGNASQSKKEPLIRNNENSLSLFRIAEQWIENESESVTHEKPTAEKKKMRYFAAAGHPSVRKPGISWAQTTWTQPLWKTCRMVLTQRHAHGQGNRLVFTAIAKVKINDLIHDKKKSNKSRLWYEKCLWCEQCDSLKR